MKLETLLLCLVVLAAAGAAKTPDPDTPPDNITLELRLDAGKIYSDGSEITSSSYATSSFDYPYIVSGQPIGLVSYSDALKLSYQNSSYDTFKITQSAGKFLMPFTSNGYQTVEDRQDEVEKRELLNIPNPSFRFSLPENRFVKVSYVFQHTIDSFQGTQTDIEELTVRNKLNGKKDVELVIQAD